MGLREERDSTPDSPEEPGGIHASTFVPPHMLEQARSGALELTNSVHVRPQTLSPEASGSTQDGTCAMPCSLSMKWLYARSGAPELTNSVHVLELTNFVRVRLVANPRVQRVCAGGRTRGIMYARQPVSQACSRTWLGVVCIAVASDAGPTIS